MKLLLYKKSVRKTLGSINDTSFFLITTYYLATQSELFLVNTAH